MRSACLVRTRFILNNFSVIGLGGSQDPPPGYAPVLYISLDVVMKSGPCPLYVNLEQVSVSNFSEVFKG